MPSRRFAPVLAALVIALIALAVVSPSEPASADGTPIARLRIPSAYIDANVIPGYLTDDGSTMKAPGSYFSAAWYEYSAVPGTGGNAVFAGHVDSAIYGTVVFWNLRWVREGDVVQIDMADGRSLGYQVVLSQSYYAWDGSWDWAFGHYDNYDIITLYTCTGTFYRGSGYDYRHIVRAVRVW